MNERKLKAKLVEKGISVEAISYRIGINPSTFYRKIKSDSFTIAEVRIIIEVLQLTHDEIMDIFFSDIVADVRKGN